MFFINNWILFLHPLAFYSTFYKLKREAVRGRWNEEDWVKVSFGRDGKHSCMVQFDLLPPPPGGKARDKSSRGWGIVWSGPVLSC